MVATKKKSYLDWLWNWCIRARLSRKREGCTYWQYKNFQLDGYGSHNPSLNTLKADGKIEISRWNNMNGECY